MTTGNFSAAEWKQIVNAPQLIYHLLAGSEKAGFFTKRGEARALEDFYKSARSQSPLVQQIIAGQKDADDKIDVSPEQAKAMLAQVGKLIESKTDVVTGDAIREFLMDAAQAVAEAEREERRHGGQPVSTAEQATLAAIGNALEATEADKRRRHGEAVAAEAQRQTEAQKKVDEARQKREAEEKAKREAEARAKREAETREMMEESRRKREEDARKAAAGQAAAEAAAKKAAEEKAAAEAAAKKAAEEKAAAEAAAKKVAEEKARAEAEALKAEARQREAEAAKPAAEAVPATVTAKPAAEPVSATVTAKAAPKAEERIYVVKKGDTLSGIAEEVYGNAGRWKEIFEANRDVIDKPNLIRPGWKLRIP